MAYVSTPFLFPFCPDTGGGTGTDVPFPIAQTKEQIVEWFWRIRKWNVTITPDDPLEPPETREFSVLPANESELVCKTFGELLDSTIDFEFPVITVSFTFQLFYDAQIALFDGVNYYPSIYAQDQSGAPITDVVSSGPTSFTARLDTDVISADVSFEAVEWWAYNPGSGGDVWDTSSGSQLRNPYSIQQAG